MKKRIGFILIIIGIVVGADLLVGAVTGKLIKEVPDVGVNQTNTAQALFSRTADILILGSSRANHSFDCKVLEDSLGMSCYNAGRDGQNMAYDAMVFFSYMERHKPKMVILDIASAMLDASWFDNLKEMYEDEADEEVYSNKSNTFIVPTELVPTFAKFLADF